MRLFQWAKDGGPESFVHGLFIIEVKWLFSVVILHFSDGAREAYHTHAFNALSWVFKGKLVEDVLWDEEYEYTPSLLPIYTPRKRFHKVTSVGDTWVITFRGPWAAVWKEYIPPMSRIITLTHGRKVVA